MHLDAVLDDADHDIIADERASLHQSSGLFSDLGTGGDRGAVSQGKRACWGQKERSLATKRRCVHRATKHTAACPQWIAGGYRAAPRSWGRVCPCQRRCERHDRDASRSTESVGTRCCLYDGSRPRTAGGGCIRRGAHGGPKRIMILRGQNCAYLASTSGPVSGLKSVSAAPATTAPTAAPFSKSESPARRARRA